MGHRNIMKMIMTKSPCIYYNSLYSKSNIVKLGFSAKAAALDPHQMCSDRPSCKIMSVNFAYDIICVFDT